MRTCANNNPPKIRALASFPGPCIWLGLLLAVFVLPVISGCDPSLEQDFSFQASQTTNEDFEDPVLVSVGNSPATLAGGDFDDDGDLDLVVVNRLETVASSTTSADPTADGTLSLLENSGGTFTEVSQISVGVSPGNIVAGDLDGDAIPDLALLTDFNKTLMLLFSDGSGAFPTRQSFSFVGTAAQVSLVDFNGGVSSAQDVLVSIPSVDDSLDPGFLVALLNDGAGNFTELTVALGNDALITAPSRFVTGDWDGDGNLDIAVIATNNSSVISLLGAGNGTFTVVTQGSDEFVQVGSGPFHIVTEDFNRDGVTDLAVSNRFDLTVSILPGVGDGAFEQDITPETLVEASGRPERLLTGAFTSRGVDIVVVQRTGARMTFLDGNGGGSFTASELVMDGDPFAIAKGYFNTDNDLDFVTVESTRRLLSIFTGDGNGSFERTVVGFDTRTTLPTVLDLNEDGFDDLVLLHPSFDRVVLLLNCHPSSGAACP